MKCSKYLSALIYRDFIPFMTIVYPSTKMSKYFSGKEHLMRQFVYNIWTPMLLKCSFSKKNLHNMNNNWHIPPWAKFQTKVHMQTKFQIKIRNIGEINRVFVFY